jgi:type II secretory pathway predicted ATPase ExeA
VSDVTPDSPFTPLYSRQSFLETPGSAEALLRLDDGLGAREPFLVVTGGPGTGKTTLAYEAVARWGSRVTAAFVAYPALSGAEFLEEVIRRFGAEPPDGANRSKLIACLERALAEITGRGQVAMLVVDDAHDISLERLEELRLLVNAAQQVRRPLEVLLIGLPSLDAKLDEPALVALRQRVSVRARLEPLSAAETRHYLHHRINAVGGDGPSLFSRKTCRDIAARTGGVPREINTLAAEALRVARVRGDQTVGVEQVQMAATALGGFVPTGDVDDSADAGAEDSPASTPPPRPITTVRTPAIPPTAAQVVAATPIEEDATPTPAPPANHDPREWVKRFVGDKGPVQIGSRALAESSWAAESAEPKGEEAPSTTERRSMPRGWQFPARPRTRSGHRGSLPAAAAALLAAIVVVAAIALVIRVGGLARSRAGQGGAVATSTTAPSGADKASSPGAPRTGSRTAEEAPAARVDGQRSERSTTRSRGPFTLDVGGSLDLESALRQRDEMQRLTGFEGWVIPAADGGDSTYRIVVGMYRSYERAAAAAHMLLNSRTLHKVTVVPLPPRSARQ